MAFHTEVTSQSGQIDARSFMDGSGWTVSTGASTKATGGDRAQGSDAWGDVPTTSSMPSMAGLGLGGMTPTMMAALAAAALFGVAILRKRG